ncbi:MAG: DUF3618 domain-containing protein, partial [Mycobacterium leprae]
MGKDPDTIRRAIEETRSELGRDLDTLTDKVNPARVVERRVGRAKSAVGGLRDRVMGSASEATSTVSSTVGSTVSEASARVSDATSRLGDTASAAPDVVRERTEGNPLAAGLIAFGVGWLASTVLPASRPE